MAGGDPRDESCADRPLIEPSLGPEPSLAGRKLGVPENFYFDDLHPDIEAAVRKAISILEDLGAELVSIKVPDIEEFNEIARLILLAEATSVHEKRLQERRSDFGDDVRALFDQGRFVRASEYLNAQRRRRALIDAFNELLAQVDTIVTPTISVPPAKIGQNTLLLAGVEHNVRIATTRNVRALNLHGPATALRPLRPHRRESPHRPARSSAVSGTKRASSKSATRTNRRPTGTPSARRSLR